MSTPLRKKVSPQIRDLAERNISLRERTLYVIVGDNARDQVVNLHYMLSKLTSKKPNVLWCYKKELGFSSNQKKRMKEVKKNMKSGYHDANLDDPFDMFQKTTDVRYCFYRDTEQILGKTFGMCILQDFEALTPNILCKTIETVEGGGFVVLLLRTMSSLRQLYSVTMDMHKKYRNEDNINGDALPNGGQTPATSLFNERFILSLGGCMNCIVMDDEMNILPLSGAALKSLENATDAPIDEDVSAEISAVSKVAASIKPIGDVVINMSRTVDQAKAVLEFTQTLCSGLGVSSALRKLVCLTSGRGRGKSAALGMAIGSAIALGYSNIIVTAPSNNNVTTVFEFISKILQALGFQPHVDYVEVCTNSSNGSNNATDSHSLYSTQKGSRQVKEVPSQIIISKNNHRQSIQFIPANECGAGGQAALASAEILIIDEAAAIPLPVVKSLVTSGNHITLMSSTVHGYEGTGRALSLKLISELKRSPSFSVTETHMETPIRYALGDKVEKWLNNLLCLDSTEPAPLSNNKLVNPSDCQLYVLNRSALFSHHKATEKFLKNLVSLFVSSHYKNSPDDLMLMSDAPKHQVLALVPPVTETDAEVPEVYVAIQVALEGKIGSRNEILAKSNLRPNGDMIPWTLSLQYGDTDFGKLNGLRIVRIAVHPHLNRMGYGSEALRQLIKWVDRIDASAATAIAEELTSTPHTPLDESSTNMLTEVLKPRKLKKPLLTLVTEDEAAEILFTGTGQTVCPIDFLGTSFGLTQNLFNFWNKAGFVPLYLRQTVNDTTGEFTTMMLRANDREWLGSLYRDFSMRFMRLLSGCFKGMSAELSLSMMSAMAAEAKQMAGKSHVLDLTSPASALTLYDLKRLRSYGRGETDYHLITDLVPVLAELVFKQLVGVNKSMPFLAKRILIGMGCQRKTLDEIYEEDKTRITIPQILGIFKPTVDKIALEIEKMAESQIKSQFKERKNLCLQAESSSNKRPLQQDSESTPKRTHTTSP